DRVRAGDRIRVADLRPVEGRTFAATPHLPVADEPALRIAVREAHVSCAARELVRHPVRVRRVEDRVATVAVDDLRERVPMGASIHVRPGAVVLGPAEDTARVERIDCGVDELDRAAQLLVDVGQLDRHTREQPLAADVVRPCHRTAGDTVTTNLVALRRDFRERSDRAVDATVRTFEDLGRIPWLDYYSV